MEDNKQHEKRQQRVHEMLLKRMSKKLDLSDEQIKKVEIIINNNKKNMKPILDKIKTTIRNTENEISKILTPEQREKMAKFKKRFSKNPPSPF